MMEDNEVTLLESDNSYLKELLSDINNDEQKKELDKENPAEDKEKTPAAEKEREPVSKEETEVVKEEASAKEDIYREKDEPASKEGKEIHKPQKEIAAVKKEEPVIEEKEREHNKTDEPDLKKISDEKDIEERITSETPEGKEKFNFLNEIEMNDIEEKTIVKGRVILITSDSVMVDIGLKSEGIIPLEEFKGKKIPKIGNEIEVFLISKETKDGDVKISYNKANQILVLKKVKEAFDEKKVILGTIKKRIKGGFIVDIGIDAFLPLSHLHINRVSDFDSFIGKEYEFKILSFEKQRRDINIVVSRRAVQEEKIENRRRELMNSLEEGNIVKGVVKKIVDFGAFIDLGGIDALLHVTNISWGHVKNTTDVLQVNSEISVKILEINDETGKISVGLKQMSAAPWEIVNKKYKPGQVVTGKVASIVKFGVFVELEPGLQGLVPISELSWSGKIKDIESLIRKNDVAEFKILNIDKENKRLTLSLKQLISNPWLKLKKYFDLGKSVKGNVVEIKRNYLFIKLDNNITGIVYRQDISWEDFRNIDDIYKVGEEVESKILEIDETKNRLKLGIRQVLPDPWMEKIRNIREGDIAEGVVSRIVPFGAFINIKGVKNVTGLVHISKISDRKINKVDDVLKVGDNIKAKVIGINTDNHEIKLSITDFKKEEGKREIRDYLEKQDDDQVTLGNLIDFSKVKTE